MKRTGRVSLELLRVQQLLADLGDNTGMVMATLQMHVNSSGMMNSEAHETRTLPSDLLLEEFVTTARFMGHLFDLLAYQDRQWHDLMQQLEDPTRNSTRL